MNKYRVRRATLEDLEQICKIHISAFPNFFLTKLGYKFIYNYYKHYFDRGELIMIILDEMNSYIGFASGISNAKAFYNSIKKKWFKFLYPITLAMVNFDLLPYLVKKIFNVLTSDKVNIEVKNNDDFLELTSIAIKKEYQKKGFGSILLTQYIEEVRNSYSLLKGILLTTDYADNKTVHKLYKKNGFKLFFNFNQNKNRKMSVYKLLFDFK